MNERTMKRDTIPPIPLNSSSHIARPQITASSGTTTSANATSVNDPKSLADRISMPSPLSALNDSRRSARSPCAESWTRYTPKLSAPLLAPVSPPTAAADIDLKIERLNSRLAELEVSQARLADICNQRVRMTGLFVYVFNDVNSCRCIIGPRHKEPRAASHRFDLLSKRKR
jgi:hypothetical protein